MIIHLLNRRRFRTVKWAATSFLLRASRQSRGKKKLRHFLILACRTLAIAALIFAVARPLIGGFLGARSGSINTVILILDRSASMETKAASGQPSRRQNALTQISEAIKKAGSPRLLLIDSASGELHEVPDPQALSELSLTSATDTEADIPDLLIKAVDYLDEAAPGQAEIWLASDLQRNDWKPSDPRWGAIRAGLEALPSQANLRILTSADEDVENLTLQLLSSRRIGDKMLLDLKLTRRKGTGDLAVPLTFSFKGARSSERITIHGQELQFQKHIPLSPKDTQGYGWVSLPPDNNPRDNSIYFAFGDQKPLKTCLVTEDPSSASSTYLHKAATAAGLQSAACEVFTPTQGSQIDWANASLIIWHAPLPAGTIASQLTRFVNSGGSALFLPPSETGHQAIFGSSWGDLHTPPQGQFFITGNWIKDEGPWQNGQNNSPMPLGQIRAIQRRSISGTGSSLAEWDDGSPLLYRQLEGQGSAVFMSTLPDERWSNLEFTALHLVAIQRLLEKGSDRLHGDYRAIAGRKKAHTQGDEVRERLDHLEPFDPALESYRSGIYRLGERTLAVNRPPGESQAERIDRSTLEQLLKDSPYTLFENENTQTRLIAEAWRAFLIAVLLFLLAEALLCLQPKATGPPLRARKASPQPSSTP